MPQSANKLRRACIATLFVVMIAILIQTVYVAAGSQTKFKRIPTHYIAALGDPSATSGNGAQLWGLWPLDPGPRGVKLNRYQSLQDSGGVAPVRWKFDETNWWLEEHGLIMEPPTVPLPPGKYLVTGGRKVTAVLTIHPGDGGWFLFTSSRQAVGVSRCARRSDASGGRLHKTGLCGTHCDRHGSGRLNRGETPASCTATSMKGSRYFILLASINCDHPDLFTIDA